MAKTAVKTTFTKGIHRDTHPRYQPIGTYRHALNKTRTTGHEYTGGLSNERSMEFMDKVSGDLVGWHRLEERDQTVIFHVDGGSKISLFHHATGKLQHVVTDSEFGCDWKFKTCEWIGEGHVGTKPLGPCADIVLYWASGLYYWKANIDELLDPKRRQSISKMEVPCDHFKLMRVSGVPKLRIRPNQDGGFDLSPGQYYAVARYGDESGNFSNWGVIDGPAVIGSKYNKFQDRSRQSIQIEVRKPSKNYTRLQIAIIPPIGSTSQDVAYVIYDGSYNTRGVTVQYYSTGQHLEPVPMAEILKKDPKFIRGKNLIIRDNRLHLYRTLQEFNPDLQRKANDIKFYAMVYAVPVDQAHRYRSLAPDEIYAPAVVYKYTDGTFSAAFHGHGPAGGANTINCTDCTLPPGQTGNNARKVKTFTTLKEVEQGEKICTTHGAKYTPNEGYEQLVDECDAGLDPRASLGGNDCVEYRTGREAIEQKVEAYENRPADMENCLDCNQEKIIADNERTEGVAVNYLEQMTDLFKTDKEVSDDCEIGKHSSIPDAAAALFEEAVETAEDDEEELQATEVKVTGGQNLEKTTETSGKDLRKQLHTVNAARGSEGVARDCGDCAPEAEPILLEQWEFGGAESCYTYPETLNCDGEPLYGDLAGQRIRFIKTPDRRQVPQFYSTQVGVESRFAPGNVPFAKDSYVTMIGLMAENVYIPSYEKGEIPKPLDPNEPYRIVLAKRERHTQTVVYNGYFVPTFKGKIGNKEYAVPRHAASSYANLDRSIDNSGSHIGEDWNEPVYMFYSPDTGTYEEVAVGDYVKILYELTGAGWTYGHYATGREPKEKTVNRKDRRGVRSALSFTRRRIIDFETCIKGIERAEFHSVLQNPEGIDKPLMNRYRESGIYLQTEQPLPFTGTDYSFLAGGLIHEFAISGKVLYGSIKRINTAPYGNIEALQYADVGLAAGPGETSVWGLVGDSFVQKWSHKRTSYISDKVGNSLNTEFAAQGVNAEDRLGPDRADGGRDRGVCDPPNRRGYRMREYLGFWQANELPESGDVRHPKNFANAHPNKTPNDIKNGDDALLSDYFYPRTLAHLNHLIVDTDTNLEYRSTAPPATREIYYEELQGIDLDSSINKQDPEDSWLNDWHNENLFPSKEQQRIKAMIRFFLVVVVPAIFGAGAIPATEIDATMTAVLSPAFIALWLVLVNNILSGKKLDRFLGIPECKTDKEGAANEDNTRGLKDNWHDYSIGFSWPNDKNFFLGMPALYNTCKCDALTDIIYSSNSQIQTSPWDAFDNFQALAFTGLDATSGRLMRLFGYGSGMYAHMTDGMYVLQARNPGTGTATEQLLGGQVLFQAPYRYVDANVEGFAGTTDPNAGQVLKHGYVSVDAEAREITIFSGQFQNITHRASGLYHFWKESMPFCNSGSCRDEMTPGGTHYTFGYWPAQEILFVTKHDGSGGGFTFSYDLTEKHYISEHSFVPDTYFWDRHHLYAVKDGAIWRYGTGKGFCQYFGKEAESSVDFVINEPNSRPFTWNHMSLDTEVSTVDDANRPLLRERAETYSTIAAWNQFQFTGVLPIEVESDNDGPENVSDRNVCRVSRRALTNWKLNNLRSYEIDRNIPVATFPACGTRDQLNLSNVDLGQFGNDQTTKTLLGKYLCVRLTHDKADRQITIHNAISHIDTADEL